MNPALDRCSQKRVYSFQGSVRSIGPPVPIAVAIAGPADAGRDRYAGDIGRGLSVIAGQRPEAVEEAEIGRLDAVLLLDELRTRAPVMSSWPFSTPPSRSPMMTSTMAISIRVKPLCRLVHDSFSKKEARAAYSQEAVPPARVASEAA